MQYAKAIHKNMAVILSAEFPDSLFVPAGSPAGALLREVDWASSPLGRPAEWPPELVAAANLLFHSLLPSFLCWGPEQAFLCNDALLPFIGQRAPALAQPLAEAWPAVWQVLAETLTRVSAHGRPVSLEGVTVSAEQEGFPLPLHLTFYCSPVMTRDGPAAGSLVTCLDRSAEDRARRRHECSQALAARLSEAGSLDELCRHSCHELRTLPEERPLAFFFLFNQKEGKIAFICQAGPASGMEVSDELALAGEKAVLQFLSTPGLTSGAAQEIDLRAFFPEARLKAGARGLAVPLLSLSRQPLGLLLFGLPPLLAGDEGYRRFLASIAGQFAVAAANLHLRTCSRDTAARDRLDLLLRTSRRVVAEKDLEGVLKTVVEAARKLTGGRLGVAGHGYRPKQGFKLGAFSRAGAQGLCLKGDMRQMRRGGVYLDLFDHHETLRLTDEDLRRHPSWWGLPQGHVPLRGLLATRMPGSPAGQPAGLLMVSDKEGGLDFTAEDEWLLKQLAALASLAIRHIEARLESEKRACEAEEGRRLLSESEGRLRAIVDYAPAVIFVKDLCFDYMLANEQFARITGIDRRRLRGVNDYALFPAEIADRLRVQDKKVLASGMPLETEEEFSQQDGLHTYFTIKFPLVDELGNTYAVAGISTDITERKRMEERLQRSNEELEQFASIVSHDLREPLRTIGGFLNLIQRRYGIQLDEHARELIHFAVDGAERLDRMITDLLDYSRFQRQQPVLQPVDLFDVYLTVVESLHASIEETGAHIFHDPLPVVTGDPSQLVRLLQNLIGNALKFRGERVPEIELRVERREGEWLLSLSDNGIGIDPAHRERIFQIFQRLHTQKEYPGTGIGLAVCKKIVEHHGGRIWVESKPGEGTTFYFTIARETG